MNNALKNRLVSFIVPAYNEQENIVPFSEAIASFMNSESSYDFEVIFVDDGSEDSTVEEIASVAAGDQRFRLISLSRNFGKEIALTAGLDHCSGDAAIPIDADLQHPISVAGEFLRYWERGFDMVSAVREDRSEESVLKRRLTEFFYGLMARLDSKVALKPNAGDFRLISRPVIDALCNMREKHRFMKGLYSVAGFKEVSIPYTPQERYSGSSKWSFVKLLSLAIEGVTSFTTAPLRFATATGFLCAITAIIYAFWVLFKTLVFGEEVAGYPTLILVVLFLGGIQLFALGIIGEYLGRIFNETKQRPLYFVKANLGFDDREASGARVKESSDEE